MVNLVKEQVDRRRLNKKAESEPVESSCVVLAYDTIRTLRCRRQ
jgi:hypothetical protein